jgi:hypothetical protein
MSIDDRAEMFGQPSDSLVPEAVWAFHEDEDEWPTWDATVDGVAEITHGDSEDAEARLLGAIADGEVLARLEDEAWIITLAAETADRIARRYLETTLKRPNEEDAWRE